MLAAADGVVVQADEHYSWGNFVVIDHGTNGEGHSWRTLYAHLQSYAVEVGQHVTQGQIIGYVGNTGQSTSNHCHFEVYVDNILTSPRWFTAYHGEGDSAEPTDEERQELIDRCVDAKLYDAMHTMDEALDGQGAQTVIFSLPLVLSDDVRMSSTFAQNRTGVDLAAPEGTTVLAAADGTVTEYDYNEDDGYYLVLYHGMDDGASWQTRYSHLGSVKVQVGQQVVQGQEIAACGSTGASTGPHLHWPCWRRGCFFAPFLRRLARMLTTKRTNYRQNRIKPSRPTTKPSKNWKNCKTSKARPRARSTNCRGRAPKSPPS